MENTNNTNKSTAQRQPSLREQANAKMRAKRLAEEKANESAGVKKETASRVQPKKTENSETQSKKAASSKVQAKNTASTRKENVSENTNRSIERRPSAKDVVNTEKTWRDRERISARPKEKKDGIKLPFPTFYAFLIGYVIILLILAVIFLNYTDKSLIKYENSQPEYYMTDYIDKFTAKVNDGSLTKSDFSFEDMGQDFVDPDVFVQDYLSSLSGISSFTYEKDSTVYNTEAPVYTLLGDGTPIATVKLKAISQSKIMAILTVMKWDVDSIKPILNMRTTSYCFIIPEGYSPVINGNAVDASYITGQEEIAEFENVKEYADMPKMNIYNVYNVAIDATVSVMDENGVSVPYENNNNTIKAFFSSGASEVSEDRKSLALSIAQTYEAFLTNDYPNENGHGFARVQQFLIKDSYFWNLAKAFAYGPDITFMSNHTFNDPKYSDIVIDNYVEYSEKCYSIHIKFTKNMYLPRTKENATNVFDSTVYFVLYDDPDDPNDSPHWCIADMIATTNADTANTEAATN